MRCKVLRKVLIEDALQGSTKGLTEDALQGSAKGPSEGKTCAAPK